MPQTRRPMVVRRMETLGRRWAARRQWTAMLAARWCQQCGWGGGGGQHWADGGPTMGLQQRSSIGPTVYRLWDSSSGPEMGQRRSDNGQWWWSAVLWWHGNGSVIWGFRPSFFKLNCDLGASPAFSFNLNSKIYDCNPVTKCLIKSFFLKILKTDQTSRLQNCGC